MNQYGQDDLVNNPRYQGQAGGTDLRGPEGESRYGAMPTGTGTGQGYGASGEGIVDRAKDAVGMGPNSGYDNRRDQPGYGTSGYGQPREGLLDKAKDAVGMGPNSGYDTRRDQPGYGTEGYGQPREGILDKAKDAVGMGPNSGYGQSGYDNRRDQPGYGTTGYGQPREGIVDKAKDAVGMGPNSGYDTRRDQPGYGTEGYGQPREGIVDKAKDAVGMGPNSGYGQSGYDTYGNPQREGVVDKMKDTVGMGPNSGRPYGASQDYNPNVNHPSGQTGFGGGLSVPQGTNTGYDESQNLGSGYDNRMGTGADAYGQPRREGMVDRMEDKVGMGPNSGYDDRTRTGMDAYVHGNHPVGMQDRITGVNEPSMLEGPFGVQGVGHPDGVLAPGEHVPENLLGERRTEEGYDMSKGVGHLGGHNTTHGAGVGDRAVGDTSTDYDGTETGYDGSDVHDGSAPPKKGLITKIKEKIHHTH